MLTLTLNRKSWHYKLAILFGWREAYRARVLNGDYYDYEWRNNDFCSYLRRILLGCFGTLVGVTVILLLAGAFLKAEYDFFCWFYFSVIEGMDLGIIQFDLAPLGLMINCLALGGLVVVAFVRGWVQIFMVPAWLKWCFRWAKVPEFRMPTCAEIPLCEDSKRFIVAAYEAIHDKVCFKLSFNEDTPTQRQQQSD